MTYLTKYKDEFEQFKELLIKNLPARIKAGNEKHLSNINEFPTAKALSCCKFINFNNSERISFMIFDIDKFEDKTALAYFENIDIFLEYVTDKIGYEPTYILETQKGFHFGYHLKNHIYTNQKKVLKYILDIKRVISDILKCDVIASNRLYGVWRNPLLHKCYFSECINYELSDFKSLIPKKENKNIRNSIVNTKTIDIYEIQKGNRNNQLFEAGMRFAKGQKALNNFDVLEYISGINTNLCESLSMNELQNISKSIYRYWQNDKILFGSIQKDININEGIMGFEKMKNLSYEEYIKETRRRQSLSAYRTNQMRKNKKDNMEYAKKIGIQKNKIQNENKVKKAIEDLGNENIKLTVSSISKKSGLDRRTVKKYMDKN